MWDVCFNFSDLNNQFSLKQRNFIRDYSRKLENWRDFQKNGRELLKKGKIFENLGQNIQNLKIF